MATIDTSKYSKYKVTGVLRNGRRFPAKVYEKPQWAFGINLWSGSVWGYNKSKRKWELLKRVS